MKFSVLYMYDIEFTCTVKIHILIKVRKSPGLFVCLFSLTWSREEDREVGMLRPGGRPWRPGGRPSAPGGRPGRPGGPFTRLAILAAWPAWAWACNCISLAMSGLCPPPAAPPPPEAPIAEFRSAIVT